MVAHSHPRGFFAGVPIMVWKIAEPRNDGIEHRNIDQLTAIGFFPLVKREENAQSGIHPRGDIGDRKTGPGRLVRIAGGGNDPPFSLDEEIIGLDVPVGTVLAIAGERAIDEPWIDRAKRFVAKAKALRDARSIILEEDVGSLRQFLKYRSSLFVLNIDRETALVSIEPNIARRETVNHRVPAANNVADAGPLDFNYFRAHVGEEARGKRAGKHLLKGQDLDAV